MLSLGSLAFASPWLLAGLAALPVLWWLLRVTPPSPRRLRFPAIRLLLGLQPREETPARTPLWLMLLRMALAACIIVALAHPLLNPTAQLAGSGPVVLFVDDDWAAARDWPARQTAMTETIGQAERQGKQVVLVGTAPPPGDEAARPLSLMRPADARAAAQAMVPRPWAPDRKAAVARLEAMKLNGTVNVVWVSDGLDDGAAYDIAERLQHLGSLRLVSERGNGLAHLLTPAERETPDLTVAVQRADAARDTQLAVRATAEDGRLLARETVRIPAGVQRTDVRLPMPTELRNRAARIEIEGETTPGSVMLLDERWRRRPVGIAGRRTAQSAQPLLTETYYIERALAPFSEVRHGSVSDLLKRDIAVIVLPDSGTANATERDQLVKWMDSGGVVLRFAGPALAQNADPALLPVTLRKGGRTIGGALSWEKPAHLAPFPSDSPFAGLTVPGDVTVSRQVLAEPSLDLPKKTWARLTDGTPLVTGEKHGKGWLVLVHTTGSPEWSNLSLSGLFVEMLRRIGGLSQGVASGNEANLAPLETLDGFGRLHRAPSTARPITGNFAQAAASAKNPPGFYGTEDARRALNLSSAVKRIAAIQRLPTGVERDTLARGSEVDLRPWLLAAALLLLLGDLVIAYGLRGLLWLGPRAAAGAFLAFGLFASQPAAAQNDEFAIKATTELRLAYVRTGVPEIDEEVRAGLVGLTGTLQRRTSVEAADPVEVNPETDELIFFPLLYWAIAPEQPALSPKAVERVNHYLATGGTILFDTRDQGAGPGSAASQRLRQLVHGLKIPPLVPIPPDHVLTKSFYLMQDFPGRWSGGTLWVEPTEDRVNDGVSTVVLGSNDWAGAWAVDGEGRPLYAVVPGGEAQREQALRFGVNLVMYALTGNYKSDQVHVPAILERLGQ